MEIILTPIDRLMQLVARGGSSHELNGSYSSESPCNSDPSEHSPQVIASASTPDTRQGNQKESILDGANNTFYGQEHLFTSTQEFSEQQESTWDMFNGFGTMFDGAPNAIDTTAMDSVDNIHKAYQFDLIPEKNNTGDFLSDEMISQAYLPATTQNMQGLQNPQNSLGMGFDSDTCHTLDSQNGSFSLSGSPTEIKNL
jgi:hypothetical protein